MPLSLPTLSTSIANVLAAQLPAAAMVASQLASSYATYASAGLFGLGAPVITPANTSAMQAAIFAAIAVPQLGNPTTFGTAWSLGLTAFWAGVAVVGGQSGSVLAIAGAAAVIAPITAAVVNLAATPQVTAALIAAAVHTASLTTTALVTNVVPTPPTIVLTLL